MFIRPLIGAFFAFLATSIIMGIKYFPFQNFFSYVSIAVVAGLLFNPLLVFFETISVSEVRRFLLGLLNRLSDRFSRAENKPDNAEGDAKKNI